MRLNFINTIVGVSALCAVSCSDTSWVTGALPPGANAEVVGTANAFITTGDQNSLFQAIDPININPITESSKPSISIDFSEKYQSIEGYGAALTGSSAYLIRRELSTAQRAKLLKQLFSPTEGIGLSYLRLTIGASDFSLSDFTYNDIPAGQTDVEVSNFSIAEDQKDIIPVLKEILAINPEIKLMGSPWSAPAWMKTNGKLEGGSLKWEYHAAYALYLKKYIDAYAAEGIHIDAITIQNEPLHETGGYPTMKMEANQQLDFVKNHLGPLFEANSIQTKIIAYDHNFDRTDYPIEVMDDADAKKYVAGSAFHAYGGDVNSMSLVQIAHPDKGLYFTEISGGEWSTDFNSNLQWNMNTIFIGTANNWSKTALFWNLALDEEFGPTNGGCQDCRGVVTVEGADDVKLNVEYYSLAHFAKYVRPGATRVKSTGQGLNGLSYVAFENVDGKKVLVVLNQNTSTQSVQVRAGEIQFDLSLAASSTYTLTWE